MSLWTEHKTPDGRTYWFHSTLLKSVWEKPDELKTQTERLLDLLPWKEYTAPDGRKYWFNKQTSVSTWQCPPEVAELVEKMKTEQQLVDTASKSTFQITSSQSAPSIHSNQSNDEIPDFQTKEEAEEAFIQFLKDSGVKSDWTWDKCMRTLVQYPMYKALKTVVERKEAFEKYVTKARKEERERMREASDKRRREFMEMLKEMKFDSYSKYGWCIKLCKQRPEWKQMESDMERERVFDDYVHELRRAEKENERQVRNKNRDLMRRIIEGIEITDTLTWKDFYDQYKESQVYKENLCLHEADLNDLLTLFEEQIKQMENCLFEQRRKEREIRMRKERKQRESFKALLTELKERGIFDVNSKWKDLYPLLKDDERFLGMVGQMGSTPMEIYRDFVTDMEEEVYQSGKLVQSYLKDAGFAFTPETEFEEYLKVLEKSQCNVKKEHLRIIFEVLMDKAKAKRKDQKRQLEKQMRKWWDDFKYYIRKSSLDVKSDTPFDTVAPLLKHLQCDDDTKRHLFEKYLKRIRKEEVGDSDTDDRHEEKRIKRNSFNSNRSNGNSRMEVDVDYDG